ncbi:DUF465 domain-containing protein [Altererythrobacter lauratis]|uniref:DUF465 domain-containing protein n=1 Tax=Alteraurantiacibacter lauratis TaxID=2054627 RepID=A0ABV7EBW5_9SPHN
MTARLYRLNEMHQRIDHALRMARESRSADPLAATRLATAKARVKALLFKVSLRSALA